MIDYKKIMSQEVQKLKPSGIRKFFDIAVSMENVISLSIGEPDFSTPWEIREAGITSLKERKTWYTSNKGLKSLCDKISLYTKDKTGLDYCSESEILVTVGGSEAIDLAIRTLVEAGDEVIIPQPSFVCYEPITRLAGGVPVFIQTKAEDGFKLTAKQLKEAITPKTKLLILPFPNNPTGAIMEKQDLKEIAQVLKNTPIMILSDEIYAEMTYGGKKHISIAQINNMKERTIIVSGFSKAFAMTGWRLGYALAPKPILEQMLKIHQFAIMCSPTTSQYGAVKALENYNEYISPMVEEFDLRRKLITDGFNKIGLTCFNPQGAFYVFPSIEKT
ncbi:MAG: aminotransferase class I/II-fold pyridoxal phosphate-dependent enzyme, partial [Oscillospiraceae bacterium]